MILNYYLDGWKHPPENISEVDPGVGVDGSRVLARAPNKPAILLQESFERAASWSM
jgi:hypothetical protein